MSKGRRYDGEAKLNYKKVFAVIIAIVVIIIAIVAVNKLLTKAKNTKPLDKISYFAVYSDNKWGILGSNGETIVNPMYQEMPIIVDENKDVFLCTYDVNEEDGNYKTKAINSKNEEILTQYDKVEALENYDKSENLWYEKDILKVEKDGKWGLIDLDGKELAEPIYDSIKTIKGIENSIIVEKDGKQGLINDKGSKIVDLEYKEIQSFGDDYKNGYITINQDNKYGITSFSGEKILENKYEKIENIYGDKYFVIKENGKQKLIDNQGNQVLSDNFDEIKQIANSGIIFKKQNKYGLMDFEGNKKIDAVYDELKEINTDIFSASKDGKTGIIDKDQNEKIEFKYKDVLYNKKAGIYIADDENYNSEIINSNFETKVTGILSEINTEDGYLKIKQDDEYKYYNFKFEEKEAKDILPSNTLFLSKKDGKYGFVDKKGNKVVDYIYDEATEQNKYGYAAIKKDGKWGSIDNGGNVVIEPTYNLDNNLVIDFIGKWHLGQDLNMNYYCDK